MKGVGMKKVWILVFSALMLVTLKANAQSIYKKVKYGTHVRNYVDVYLPNPSLMPKGLIIWIHGGAWNSLSTDEDYSNLEYNFAEAYFSGYAVVAVNYRLVGQGGEYPNNVQDIIDVLAAVENLGCRNCPDLGVWVQLDPYVRKGVMVSGGSAGGHLAVMGAGSYLNSKARGSSNIRCVNNNYGPLDMRPRHMYQPLARDVIDKMANGASMNVISPTYYQEQGVIDRLSLNSRFNLKWVINYNYYDTLVPAKTISPFIDGLRRSGHGVKSMVSYEKVNDDGHAMSKNAHKHMISESILYCYSR